MSAPVWKFLNRTRIRLWQNLRSKASPYEQRIVEALDRDGIVLSSLEELGLAELAPQMQKEAATIKDRWVNDAAFREQILGELESKTVAKGAKKTFLLPLYGGGWITPTLEIHNPYITFSLSDTVLSIASAYLHLVPRFDLFNLSETVLTSADAKFSQRWHRDPEDKRLLKIFIYLSDVEEEGAGPFMYVRGSNEGGKYRNLFPQQFPQGSYPDTAALESAVNPADMVKCFGKAGTVIFCDTSGLHRGGFSTTKERMMFTAGFVPGTSTQPRKFRMSAIDSETLSPLQKAALLL
jgi:hypothetical protein